MRYDAVYVYETLNLQETDDGIASAIGNLNALKIELERNGIFRALFTVSDDESTFSFTGKSFVILMLGQQRPKHSWIKCLKNVKLSIYIF